jgi:hypothetical protein
MATEKDLSTHLSHGETGVDSSDNSIRRVDVSQTDLSTGDANEEIVRHLQTTGEEVGLTWRSILAASVSRPRTRSSTPHTVKKKTY